jgi:hypothetical protein
VEGAAVAGGHPERGRRSGHRHHLGFGPQSVPLSRQDDGILVDLGVYRRRFKINGGACMKLALISLGIVILTTLSAWAYCVFC